MKTISRLLSRSIIPPFLIALLVLTFVLFSLYLGNRSELLISRNASLDIMLAVAAAIFPGILIFTIPLSYLIGILIGISGLSGESQITALRACGIPIRKLIRFILFTGLIAGLITCLFSTVILPHANFILSRMMDRVSLTLATSLVHPRVFNEDFPNKVFYVDDLTSDKQHLKRVFLADSADPASPRAIYIAKYGSWVTDSAGLRLQLNLDQGSTYSTDAEDPSRDDFSSFVSTDIPINSNHNEPSTDEIELRPKKVTEQSTLFLWNNYKDFHGQQRIEQLIELNKRIALPFSVFPFAILGLALAVGTPKGSRTSGFALSLVTVIAFYMLFSNGIRLASVGKVTPWLGAWGANIVLAVIGIILIARAEQSFQFIHWISKIAWHLKGNRSNRRHKHEGLRRVYVKIDNAIVKSTRKISRFQFPKILDFYISRGFFVYFLWSLLTCGTLFILLTLFDLLDDIIRNQIPVSSVIDYFTFLTPQILMLIVPMSILLAILINFGILEKNSEITAIKAGGWSLYRIGIPIFLIASCLCVSLFMMQDYVLPSANTRQEQLRNTIKGRPPQTSKRLQRKWILGENGRIYNYEYFDEKQDSFVNLNVFETDFTAVRILRRIHAARARIQRNGSWLLEDGWIRDYQSAQTGFRKIGSEELHFPERASYFEREIFQPKESSKMKYLDLKNYIYDLKKSGYNATELQVELHKKASFPLSCLVMALLGIPFSFSTGRKGAFFGIGMSIAIAITYWGIAGLFEAMGTYGLLIPILAAWAPNILFGAAGLALLLTIRT
jgi:LPS export ABC transporter permease LptG/LPS export ABC transporter permease LptF